MVAAGAAMTRTVGDWALAVNLTPPGMGAGLVGLALLGVAVIFGRKALPGLVLLGAALVALAGFDLVVPAKASADVALVGVVVGLGAAVGWRTGMWTPIVPMGMPVGWLVWARFSEMGGWRYVIVSFVLLFGGVLLSLRKPRPGAGP